MKLPSLRSLWLNTRQVFFRFPLEVIAAILATLAWLYIAGSNQYKLKEDEVLKFIAVCNMALTLLLATDLYAEVHGHIRGKKWVLRLIAILICTGLFFMLKPSFYTKDFFRIGLLIFAFHLLVAFAPFIRTGTINGFWQFNKVLFIRFLTTALYLGVLYAGLAMALLAVSELFGVRIESAVYGRLLAVVVGLMTVFFLSGLPKDFKLLDKDEFYPKSLKIFTQYVLIPLMTVYLAILLVYEVKILISWQFPKGLVSSLILGYTVFGVLSILLVYPIREKEGNGWIKLFSRFFYVMIIPLVILLLLAVWKRVSHYGITESRYILMMLALWLSVITVYFLTSKAQNIKIIPISLCILALLATYGPQSAFSISENAQVTRLKRLLASKKEKDIEEQKSVVEYLVKQHGLTALQAFTKVDLKVLEASLEKKNPTANKYLLNSKMIDTACFLLKINKNKMVSAARNMVRFSAEHEDLVNVKGYDYIMAVGSYTSNNEDKLNGVLVSTMQNEQNGQLIFKMGEEFHVKFDVNKMGRTVLQEYKKGKLKEKKDLRSSYGILDHLLTTTQYFNRYEITFTASYISIYLDENGQPEKDNFFNYSGYILIKVK